MLPDFPLDAADIQEELDVELNALSMSQRAYTDGRVVDEALWLKSLDRRARRIRELRLLINALAGERDAA